MFESIEDAKETLVRRIKPFYDGTGSDFSDFETVCEAIFYLFPEIKAKVVEL